MKKSEVHRHIIHLILAIIILIATLPTITVSCCNWVLNGKNFSTTEIQEFSQQGIFQEYLVERSTSDIEYVALVATFIIGGTFILIIHIFVIIHFIIQHRRR